MKTIVAAILLMVVRALANDTCVTLDYPYFVETKEGYRIQIDPGYCFPEGAPSQDARFVNIRVDDREYAIPSVLAHKSDHATVNPPAQDGIARFYAASLSAVRDRIWAEEQKIRTIQFAARSQALQEAQASEDQRLEKLKSSLQAAEENKQKPMTNEQWIQWYAELRAQRAQANRNQQAQGAQGRAEDAESRLRQIQNQNGR